MKRKLFALLFVMAILVVAFASCGGGECTHPNETSKVTTAPTCTEAGVKTYTCPDCQAERTEPIAAEGHIEDTKTVPSTCTTAGSVTVYCTVCETVISTEALPLDENNHEFSTEWEGDGTHHWHEASCECEDVEPADKAEHTLDPETGLCTVCGKGVCTHEGAQVMQEVAATCTEPGYKALLCPNCGRVTIDYPALGHDMEHQKVDPECNENGYEQDACKRGCGLVENFQAIYAEGHKFGDDGVCTVCTAPAKVTVTYDLGEGADAENPNKRFFAEDDIEGGYHFFAAKGYSADGTGDVYGWRFIFVGWYLDPGFENEAVIDANTPATITVYAKWIKEEIEDPNKHVHTFEDKWTFDDIKHWHESNCEHKGETSDTGLHTWDSDSYCTVCGRRNPAWEKTYTILWDTNTTLHMQLNEDTNNEELPPSSKRYLAGDDGKGQGVDTLISTRNANAYAKTGVNLYYSYLKDSNGHEWGENIDYIFQEVGGEIKDKPDIYVNFVYDMLATSLKGSFSNLLSTQMGEGELYGKNEFQFLDRSFKDTGTGYMVDYMRSMTLSLTQMYLLSSDYFIDMVRSFFVVPVNVTLLEGIAVDPGSTLPGYNPSMADKFNSDRDGDKDFDIADFFELVWDGQWNYETLADFSQAVYVKGTEQTETVNPNGTMNDTIGFALATGSGLSASGMLYTTPITIISNDWSDEKNDYVYAYPTHNQQLLDFCDNISDLFANNSGVIAISNDETQGKGPDALQAIRNRFAENRVLFGGVICLGSLESQEYLGMKEKDWFFGVAPVPLYRTVNPDTNRPDDYLTQIHNIGRVGAISAATTKFAQCTAFLDYQSTHSTEVLDAYYNDLTYNICGDVDGNVEMLRYIRRYVRSSFDKAFEDAIGVHYKNDGESNPDDGSLSSMDSKWHSLIKDSGYTLGADKMAALYKDLIDVKIIRLKQLQDEYKGLPK